MLDSDIAKAIQVERHLGRLFRDNAPGGVVLVAREGVARFISAYGLADRKSRALLTPQHAFHLASVGKQFTGVTLLMLAERGRLALDDPVSKHLPELIHYGNNFTILHLLHHTSGIPDYYNDNKLNTSLFKRAAVPTNRDALAVLAKQEGPRKTPGETFKYSNSGYDLLGLLVERVSGEPSAIPGRKHLCPAGNEGHLLAARYPAAQISQGGAQLHPHQARS